MTDTSISIQQFINMAPTLYETGSTIEIVGAPGSAKSSAMHAVTAALSTRLGKPVGIVTHFLATFDVPDIRGFAVPLKVDGHAETRFTKPPVIPTKTTVDVYVDGKLDPDYDGPLPEHGIVFLDEFAQCDQLVQKVAAEFLLSGRIGEFRLPKGWVVWAAGNRTSDRSGVVKRLSFVQNRLGTYHTHLDFKSWQPWANENGIHPLFITFAKRYPSLVFIEAVPAEDGPYCTARSFAHLAKIFAAFKDKNAPEHILPTDENALVQAVAWIGEKVAVELMNHLRVAHDLPDIEAVAKKPLDIKIPERADGQYIMASMLAHHVSRKNADAFLQYMERLGVDMQVMFVEGVVQRKAEAVGSERFAQWISKNQELLAAAKAV